MKPLKTRLDKLERRADNRRILKPVEFVEIVCEDDWPRPDPATLPPARPGTIEMYYSWRGEIIRNEQQG